MSISPKDIKLELNALQRPLQLGPTKLANRVVMSSLTRSRGYPEDMVNDVVVEYYRQRAGAGLIMSEGTMVSPQGDEWGHVANLYSEEHAVAWKRVTDAVHAEGGKIYAQLWHIGRVAHPDMPLQKKAGVPVEAPSPIGARGGKFRDLDNAPNVPPKRAHPDPRHLVQLFAKGAQLAKTAGFDGVELHGANGYIVHQFLDTNSNSRTDEWGGSVENRCRFAIECLDALIEIWGAERVSIKLNPCGGYNDVGMGEAETISTFTYLIKHCVDRGLAVVQLVRYLPSMDAEFDGKKRSLTYLDVLETFGPHVRREGSSTKLFLNGDLGAKEGNDLIESGKIDAAVYGRSYINNPDLPKRLFEHLPLNETLGFAANPKTFYTFDKEPSEGYTTYPAYEAAIRRGKKKE